MSHHNHRPPSSVIERHDIDRPVPTSEKPPPPPLPPSEPPPQDPGEGLGKTHSATQQDTSTQKPPPPPPLPPSNPSPGTAWGQDLTTLVFCDRS